MKWLKVKPTKIKWLKEEQTNLPHLLPPNSFSHKGTYTFITVCKTWKNNKHHPSKKKNLCYEKTKLKRLKADDKKAAKKMREIMFYMTTQALHPISFKVEGNISFT